MPFFLLKKLTNVCLMIPLEMINDENIIFLEDKNKKGENHTSTIENLYVDYSKFLFRLILLSIIEFIKISYGQQLWRVLFDILFYFFFLLATSFVQIDKNASITCTILTKFKISFFFLIILVIDISELISWNFIKNPINTQAVNAIDIKVIIEEYPNFLYYFFILVPSILLLFFFPFYKIYKHFPQISLIVHQYNFLLLFIFIIITFHDFHDPNNVILYESKTYDYDYYFKKLLRLKINQTPKVLKASKQLKNLIQIQLESYSGEIAENPIVSPNLYSFIKQYEYVSPLYTQAYSTWTIGAAIIMQVGIPQIMPDTGWSVRVGENIDYVLGLQGLPDILNSAGYNLHFGTIGKNNVMGFSQWEKRRNFTRIYTASDDNDLYNYFTNVYLPKIDKDIRDSNFQNKYMTIIQNYETHIPYFIPKWCKMNFDKMNEKEKCFHCIDKLVGDLIRKYIELKMYEHSVLVVFPDHRPFSLDPNKYYNRLYFLFPAIQKVDSNLKIK